MPKGRGSQFSPLSLFDPEPERTFLHHRREVPIVMDQDGGSEVNDMTLLRQQLADMTVRLEEQNRQEERRRATNAVRGPPGPQTLGKYMMSTSTSPISGVVIPTITARNFELKFGLLGMIHSNQFSGFTTEDTRQHMHTFLDIVSTMIIHGVPQEAIRLYAFRFLLHSKA